MTTVTFPPAYGGDGSTVSDDSNPTTGLRNGGYLNRFVPSLANVVAMAGHATAQAALATASASSASASAGGASASAASAAAIYDAFDDRYLGAKASNPTLDNDGQPLIVGALYFNSTVSEMRVWNGSSWVSPSALGGTVASLNVMGLLYTHSNMGVNDVPAAWGNAWGRAIQVNRLGLAGDVNCGGYLFANAFFDGADLRYIRSGPAVTLGMFDGKFVFSVMPTGLANEVVTSTEAMTIDVDGRVLMGAAASGSGHVMKRPTTEQQITCELRNGDNTAFAVFTDARGGGASGAAAALFLNKNTSNNRSINTAGTVNTSGSDYAEYEQNGGLLIEKGQIVGFDANGVLTLTYADALRFGIKSTAPSFVGGDVWADSAVIGERPMPPSFVAPQSDESQNFAVQLQAAKDAHQIELDAYAVSLAEWEERLEAARVLVDRIAYTGKVPVNVTGAVPGQYVVAVESFEGGIEAELVNPQVITFEQYRHAVGRVNKILEDGRAEVAVIVH